MVSPKLFVIAFVFGYVSADPIIIRSGLSRDHAQAKHANVLDAQVAKADHNFVNQEGYDKDSEKKFVDAHDTGKFNQANEDKKLREQQGNFNDQKFHRQQGNNESNYGKKQGHKKGHHKQGFHNSYHKDETGTQSSYYDDSNDEADEYVHNAKNGAFGDSSAGQNRGVYQDRVGHLNQNAKHGGYNNGGGYNKERANRDNYNRGQYVDDRYIQGQNRAGNQYGEHGHQAQEQLYKKPYYEGYDHHRPGTYYPQDDYRVGYNYDLPSKKRITVYEDPRYVDRGYEYNYFDPGYDSERIHIDLRRPPAYRRTRFYNDRPNYDDYYRK